MANRIPPSITTSKGRVLRQSSAKTTKKFGKTYTEITYADRAEKAKGPERIISAIAGVVALPLQVFSAVREETFVTAYKGRIEQKMLYEDDVTDIFADRIAQREGYEVDPRDRYSVIDYLERPEERSKLEESNGNFLLRLPIGEDGVSRFLFVPNGDFEKATSVMLCNAKTGKALKGKEFYKAMHAFSSQYEEMQQGISNQIEKLIPSYKQNLAERGIAIDDIDDDDIRNELNRAMGTYVIDAKAGHTRVYARNFDPNKRHILTGLTSFIKGTYIKHSKGTKEDFKHIYKADPEFKPDKPYANPPPQPE